MKKIFFFLSVVLFLISNNSLYASHTLGGQITYKYVSGTTYKVRLTLYTDCSGIDLDFISENVSVQRLDNTGDCPQTGTNYTLNFVDTNIASDVCASVLTTCNGGSARGVREWIYEGNIVFGVGNRFEIWWNSCCRPFGIVNYSNSGNQTIHTTMYKGLHPTNNTPTIRNLKIPFICPNKPPNCYQLNAIDVADTIGNTQSFLAYELVTTVEDYVPPTTPATACFTNPFPYQGSAYSGGYSQTNPFGTGPLPCLNTGSGLLTIPTMPLAGTGNYVVVIKITEFNTMDLSVMSVVFRDFLVTVDNSVCTNATQLECVFPPPVPTAPAFAVGQDTFKICQGDLFKVTLDFNDSGALIFYENSNFLPLSTSDFPWMTAVLTGNGTANLNIVLTGTIPASVNSFDVFVDIRSGCPLPSRRTKKFHVIVVKSTFITPTNDTIVKCGQDGIALKGNGGQTYVWRDISGGPPQDIDCNNCVNVVVAPIITTTYVVESFPQAVGSTCKYKDTVQIKVAPDFLIATSANDDKVCFGTPVQIISSVSLPPAGFKYKWKRLDNTSGLPVSPLYLNKDTVFNPTTIVLPVTPPIIATPVGVYTYEVEATSPDGCKRKDEIIVNVTQEKPPVFTLTQSQKLFCDFNGSASINAAAVFASIPPAVAGCKISPSDPCFGDPSLYLGANAGSSSLNSTSQPGLLAGAQRYSKHQYLFTIAELAVAGMPNKGKISSLYFYVDTLVTDPNKDYKSYNNVTIKIGCTNLNSLGGLNTGNPFSTTPSITVFNKTLRVKQGLNEIKFLNVNGSGPLIQAYEYDGTSATPNFIIEISSTVLAPNPANAFPQIQMMSSFFTSTAYNYSATALPTTVAANSSSKPNFKFKYCGTSPLDNTVNTFNWTSNLSSATFDNPTKSDPTVIFSQSGTYTLTCEVNTASKSCKETKSIDVYVRPQVNFDISLMSPYQSICSSTAPFNILFYVNPKINTAFSGSSGITNSILGTFDPNLATAGLNNIIMTVTDSAQYAAFPGGPPCISTQTIPIIVNPFKPAKIINKPILSNSYCVDDKSVYQLDVKLPKEGVFNGALTAAGGFVPFANGAGIKTLYYTTPAPCGDKDSMIVTINPKPIISINLQEGNLCIPITLKVNAASTPNTGFYKWKFNNSKDSSVTQSVDINYQTVMTDKIELQFKDAFGCEAVATKMITTLAKPKAEFRPSPKTTSTLNPNIIFENNSIEVNGTTMQYIWNIGNLTEVYGKTASYNFEKNPGYHTISLIARSSNGCEDVSSESVNISVDYALFVPNSFNPNSANGFENRQLTIKSLGIQKDFIKFQIYDRTGAKIFESNDIATYWNGKVNNVGTSCQPGVYVWKAVVKDLSNKEYELSGSTVLLK